MMQFTTAEGLEALLGEIDPLAIERILDTHATIDEVAEALADLEDERGQGERHEPSSARVVQVRAILEDVLEDHDDDDDRGRMVGPAT
jgi:hypothetical protein